jgi:hypothetical protein
MKPRKPQYKLIDIGNTTESQKTRIERIIKQTPKGKAMILTEADLSRQNKILVKIIDPRDIPPPTRQHKHMPPDIKQALIKTGFKNVTKTGKKHMKHK